MEARRIRGWRMLPLLTLVLTLGASARLAAETTRAMSAEEYAGFSAAFDAYAKELEPYDGADVFRLTPERVVAAAAAAQGARLDAFMAREADAADSAGFHISEVAVAKPGPAAQVFETGEVLCLVAPISYSSTSSGERRRVEQDLLAIRDGGVWGFLIAPRGPLRKVQMRRVYGAFVCSR